MVENIVIFLLTCRNKFNVHSEESYTTVLNKNPLRDDIGASFLRIGIGYVHSGMREPRFNLLEIWDACELLEKIIE